MCLTHPVNGIKSEVATLRPISTKLLPAPIRITDEDSRDQAKALMFKGEFKRAWALIDMVIDKEIERSA